MSIIFLQLSGYCGYPVNYIQFFLHKKFFFQLTRNNFLKRNTS